MAYLFLIAHALGLLSSINALLVTRTPQGTIAWILSLNTIPWVAVPAYWVFGRDRFRGYLGARQELAESNDPLVDELRTKLEPYRHYDTAVRVGEQLAELPYLGGNEVELLIDGANTFESIFAGIDQAKRFVFVQFYIVRADGLGNALKAKLLEKAQQGVGVYFLYDEIGSAGLSGSYLRQLRDGGVHVFPFHTTRGVGNRFQLNFRNHRKIVVVDGERAWVGGHNVGDEYLGKKTEFGHWRDTHMRLSGPSVLGLMVSFLEDWRWATDKPLPRELWQLPKAAGDATVLILPTGPADRLETASLMYQQAIQSARGRIWIASPYFVPDQAVMHSLHLAALRGVDVRIVIPHKPDSKLIYYSAFNFAEPLLASGVRMYRYLEGFLHEKVFLIDDDVAGVGTANFDNRSFRLNFEVTAVVVDRDFARQVEVMLLRDFGASREMTALDSKQWSIWFRLAVRASSLLAPVQ